MGILIGTFFAMRNVYARDYSISRMDITAKVDDRGGAWVTQQVNYNFDGYYNGIYLVQDTHGLGKMKNVSVKVDHLQATLNPAAQDGAVGQYKIQHNIDGGGEKHKGYERIKVYQPVNSVAVTVTYHFYLSQVAKRYSDTAEINWKMIGANWDRTIDHAHVKLVLPSQTNAKFKSWIHGPTSPKKTVDHDNKEIVMNADNVSNYMEAHVLFNKSALPGADKVNKYRLQAALRRENQISAYQNLKAKWVGVIDFVINNWILAVVLMLVGPLLAVRIIHQATQGQLVTQSARKKHQNQKDVTRLQSRDISKEKLHRFDVPDVGPTLASAWYLYEKNGEELDSLVFSTFIAEQQSKKSISLEIKDDHGYVITKGSNYQSEPFLDFLLITVGSGEQVSLEQIEKFGATSDTKADKMAKKWLAFIARWKKQVTKNGNVNPLFIRVDNQIRTLGMLWLILMVLLPASWKLAENAMGINSFWFSLLFGMMGIGFIFVIGAVACMGIAWLLKLVAKKQSVRFDSWLSNTPKFIVAPLMIIVSIVVLQVFMLVVSHQLFFDYNITPFRWPLLFGTLTGLILIMLIYSWFKHSYTPYTAKGYDIYLQVIQFKQMLHDIADFDRSKLPDQILWGEYLIYAIGLQEAKRLNHQLESVFGEQAVAQVMQDQLNLNITNYFFYTSGMADFNGIFGSSIASGSTGPSSAAGGPSGGAGGGSGGGAF
ncbi:DUF2207 domain-containing protein [Paucilactobacillus wasatchensis]|nr:DUF2207 domain-containing protein [Paucilactobacillus wasatchensis]